LAVRIRLRRTGAKKRPTYRFVATDSRMPRDGRFIEILGHYNPIEKPAAVGIKEERVYYWLKQGAVPTDTVNSIFRQIGLWNKWEMMKKGEDVSGTILLTQLREKAKKKKKRKGKAPEDVTAPVGEAAAPEKPEEKKEAEKEEKAEVKPEKKEAKKEEKAEVKPEKKEAKKEEKAEAEPEKKEAKKEEKEEAKPEKKEAKKEDTKQEKKGKKGDEKEGKREKKEPKPKD
jgi:small subunit ribosomal protein S16